MNSNVNPQQAFNPAGNDMVQMAQAILQNSVQNGVLPTWGPEAINAVMSRDAQKGQVIANNLLQSYGLTKDQAKQIVRQKLGI